MTKQYASSVYSQKSTTSAKSSRSFLSLTTPVWPTTSLNEPPTSVWQNIVKAWINPKKKNDTDSISTNRSTTSINKLKQLIFKKKPTDDVSPRHSFTAIEREEQEQEEAEVSSFITTNSTVKKKQQGLVGILANCGCDSEEAILERKRRRAERREYILRQQKQNRNLQHHHIIINDSIQTETSSSSDTLLADEDFLPLKPSVKVGFAGYHDDDDDEDQEIQEAAAYWEYNPRIMFVEPSPVPRFRNVAPPPPPSPAYLNILTQPDEAEEEMIIRSPLMDEEETTVFSNKSSFLQIPEEGGGEEKTPLYDEQDDDDYMHPPEKPRLYFHPPLQRGQTLRFSLQNTIPEDHIILFKFLTSNTAQQQPERYFVQPSAGKMDSSAQSPILLILNQPPNEFVKKDKIMIRWAVIQKNTNIEHWVNNLQDSTRRRWIDMLDEEWPNQVTIRMTRIKIKFL